MGAKREGEGEGILARRPFAEDEDVEGHRATVRNPAIPEGEGEGILARRPFVDDNDVEGHLYRNLPTTQGELTRRGPGENPHGER